jgi:hypothetical protein
MDFVGHESVSFLVDSVGGLPVGGINQTEHGFLFHIHPILQKLYAALTLVFEVIPVCFGDGLGIPHS